MPDNARANMKRKLLAAALLLAATLLLGGAALAAATKVVRANMNLYFATLTAFVTAAFAWQGLISWQTFWLACAAGPAYGFGLWAGSRLF